MLVSKGEVTNIQSISERHPEWLLSSEQVKKIAGRHSKMFVFNPFITRIYN